MEVSDSHSGRSAGSLSQHLPRNSQLSSRSISSTEQSQIPSSTNLMHSKQIKEFLTKNQFEEIHEFLSTSPPGIDILSITDKKQFTLLHHFVLHLKFQQVQFLVKYARDSLQGISIKVDRVKSWLDSATAEGLTALHYASFKGDIKTLEFLVESGANIDSRNAKGLSPFHIAAQGDQPISLAFFYRIGYPIDAQELKGGTALHWASYLGSENALNFLIAKAPQLINHADFEGLTPLHLAVISGNSRVVKKLLIRGADRTAQDEKGKTPSELAFEQEFFNIKSMLDDLGGLAEFCNIKQPFKPQSKSLKQLIILFILLLISQGTILFFIAPTFNTSSIIEPAVWISLNICTGVALLFAWLSNPGRVSGIAPIASSSAKKQSTTTPPKISQIAESEINNNSVVQSQSVDHHHIHNPNKQLTDESNIQPSSGASKKSKSKSSLDVCLIKSNVNATSQVGSNNEDNAYMNSERSSVISSQAAISPYEFEWTQEIIAMYARTNDDSRICVECCIVKPKRSRHCEICKTCVRVYDHHCPWINNCVGAANHRYFIAFILCMWFEIAATLTLISLHIVDDYNASNGEGDPTSNATNNFSFFKWFTESSEGTLQVLRILKFIVSGSVLLVSALFLFMHSILCFVQLKNIFTNKTTFERHHEKKKPNHVVLSDFISAAEAGGNQPAGLRASASPHDLSISDFNPSLIQSNSRNNHNSNSIRSNSNNNQSNPSNAAGGTSTEQNQKEADLDGQCRFANVRVMCCTNYQNPQYDFVRINRKKSNHGDDANV